MEVFFQYLFLVCLCSTKQVSSNAQNHFHLSLEDDDLLHYFGTRDPTEVPHYDVTTPSELPVRREVGRDHIKQYHLNVLGKDYHLHVQKNHDLLAEGCLVHRVQANGTTLVQPCVRNNEEHCYYHGYVRGKPGSKVAVSTCDGLQGLVRTRDHDIVIQPIKEAHRHIVRNQTNSRTPHVVYQRSKRSTMSAKCDEGGRGQKFHIDRSRLRRSLGGRKYAEMMITVDVTMFEYHGEDVRRYTLTAVNIASQIFEDASLGHPISLSVVKFVVFEHEQANLEITPEASYTLNAFCTWQADRNPVSDWDPEHYDGAALITRLNIHKNGQEGLLGIAKFNGFCSKYSCCTYNEDSGLDLGLTLAHETGHNFGISHDGDGNECGGGENLMSGDGGSGKHAFVWSTCSAQYLEEFLRHERSSCLEDKPRSSAETTTGGKPGTIYDGDAQCRFFKGKDSKVCYLPGKDVCSELWCYDPSRPGMCVTNNFPKMDGTECGPRQWCIRGECVNYGTNGPKAINGGWTEWEADWSPCSRTCGGGVRSRKRSCTNPRPAYGGLKCVGNDVMAEMCNPQECAASQMDYVAEQCAETNDKPMDGRRHDWLPHTTKGGIKCQMKCMSRENEIVALRGRNFRDGTDCSSPSHADYRRCVHGTCMTFGCDGKLNSGKVKDHCGVCNGDGGSCSVVSGSYSRGEKHEYVTFLTIPSGILSVEITNANVFCHMAVAVYGHRVLNIDGSSVDDSGIYKMYGVTVRYQKSPEKITIDHVLDADIQIQVWKDYGDNYVGVNPEIEYKYYQKLASPVGIEYEWRVMTSECSKTCGTGFEKASLSCVSNYDNSEVQDDKCDFSRQPNIAVKPCNVQPCPPRWHPGSFGACSKSCGGGVMIRDVSCVRSNGDAEQALSDGQCFNLPRPPVTTQCNNEPCPGQWRPGQWSECSESCGKGYKTRQVTCHADSQSQAVADDSLCRTRLKPSEREACILKACNSGSDVCEDVNEDCAGYGENVCETHKDWAKLNCASFCGCEKNKIAEETSNSNCKDVLSDCAEYQGDMCTAYGAWAIKNCQRFCGHCPKDVTTRPTVRATPGAETCVDAVDDCTAYGADLCTQYRSWAETNCPKHCGFCTGERNTEPTTMTTSATTTVTTRPVTIATSGMCRDVVSDCGSYGSNVCTEYKSWAETNCPKHCGFCEVEVCKDEINNCAAYGHSVCSSHASWASGNCKLFCNLC